MLILSNYEVDLALSDIAHQLKRIADSLEIMSGMPKVLRPDEELLKNLEEAIKNSPDPVVIPDSSATLHADIMEEWNRELVPLGIPKVAKISGPRATKVAARIREYGKDSFHKCIEEVKQSSFLQGKSTKPWTNFNFDWMILPSNFPKVLEGNYNDDRQYKEMEAIAQQYYTDTSIPKDWSVR
jgi:hypothetical protein